MAKAWIPEDEVNPFKGGAVGGGRETTASPAEEEE